MIAKKSYILLIKGLLLTAMLYLCGSPALAQPVLPQRSITVTPTQGLHFGTFCVIGSGGTVTVGWNGARNCTSNIGLLSMSPTAHEAIFAIKLCEGRTVTISYDLTTILTGSNGGSLTLDLGPTEKGGNGASFSTNSDCNFITPLRMGGTLHVPGTAIPGTYSGSFAITFNQQ